MSPVACKVLLNDGKHEHIVLKNENMSIFLTRPTMTLNGMKNLSSNEEFVGGRPSLDLVKNGHAPALSAAAQPGS